ncbi:MAG: acyl-CoA dehydrogenase [Beijerinckiaceae bacterium]|nr:acyl-CoA dehydrogenase [Beijerinckiaceae bacterium]
MPLFSLPPEIEDVQQRMTALARDHLAAEAQRRAGEPSFPKDIALLLAEASHGRLTVSKPDGPATGLLAAATALSALARVCPRSADALHHLNFAATLLLERHGATDVLQGWAARLRSGDAVVPVAITEEEAGAQAAALRSRVSASGGRLLLNGSKTFVSNAADADAFIVYAAFGDSVEETGAVLVEAGQRGVRRETATFITGERWQSLTFEDVDVADEVILFRHGGFTKHAGYFDIERIGHSARALGVGWCAYDAAVAYASDRRQFERSIAEFQGLQWKIAEAKLGLEAAELLLQKSAALADRAGLGPIDTTLAKIHCNRAAYAACDHAIQILGARGYREDSLVSYCFRKARGYMLNGGVVELMLTRVAEHAFGRRFPQHPV